MAPQSHRSGKQDTQGTQGTQGGQGGHGKQRKHLVRPRYVWGGLAVGVLGMVIIGFGDGLSSWPIAIVGIVLLVVGGLVGWRGGALYDARSGFSLESEMKDVKEGNVHGGTKAGDEVHGALAHRESAEADRTRQLTTSATLQAQRPGLSVLGAILLVGGAAFVLATQGMYPHTHTGQGNGLRDLALAVLGGLVGLLVLLSPRRHPIGAAIALICAVGLVLQAWLAPHDADRTIGFEIFVAILFGLGGLMALDVRRPRAGLPAHGIDRTAGVVAR